MNILKMKQVHQSQNLLLGWLFFCGLFLSGCITIVESPSFPNQSDGTISKGLAQKSWAHVLNLNVDEQGRIDFREIAKNPVHLYRYVAYVAENSPQESPGQFPSLEDQLEYYLNSYNALAMYGVIITKFPDNFHSFSDRAGFFKFTRFQIGVQELSLYDYENDIIRPIGDPRVHFALNCMVRACPRLPQLPFQANKINETLDALTIEFVNHPRHVEVLKSARVVRVSEIFKFYEEDFVGSGKSPSLIAYINQYRKEPINESFTLEYIKYDWTVNYQ